MRGLEHRISDDENGLINPQAVNALRVFAPGVVSWGARTMIGYDNAPSQDWKYVPVRRLALLIEESLYRGLAFAVFEPNGERLWSQIRLAATAFMSRLFHQGSFKGQKSFRRLFCEMRCRDHPADRDRLGDSECARRVRSSQTRRVCRDHDPARWPARPKRDPGMPRDAAANRKLIDQNPHEDISMAQFTVNTNRIDPYKNFKFNVIYDGKPIAGVSKVSGLKRTTEVITHREGGQPSTVDNVPGQTKFEPITLERGVTHDTDFEDWANLVYSPEGDAAVSLANFRRDLIIQLLNLQGTPVKAWRVYRCWVSEYTPLPELDANASGFAFETAVIQNGGFERDLDITEPTET